MESSRFERFPSTAWSVVRAAQRSDCPEYVTALNRCIAAYWRPVYCFLRAHGHPTHHAEDLTQEFFLRFCERDWIRRADPQRGRFRTFLLSVLKRFLSDQGPGRSPLQKIIVPRDKSRWQFVRRSPEQVVLREFDQAKLREIGGEILTGRFFTVLRNYLGARSYDFQRPL